MPGSRCEYARNFDPTPESSQRIDPATKFSALAGSLSAPIVTLRKNWIQLQHQPHATFCKR